MNTEHYGPYRVSRRIASGALGSVYMARHTSSDRPYAVKVFEPTELGRGMTLETAQRLFVAEIREAQAMNHPHIAQIHEIGIEKGVPFAAMECVQNGRSLHRYCSARDQRLPLDDVIRIIGRCADALQYAHERGVVHRDIKPRHVLLDVGLEPKLIDFGLAVLGPQEGTLESEHGTPSRYLSPEQIAGAAPAGKQADMFSLGVVLYELLAGTHPFKATSLAEHRALVVGTRHTQVSQRRATRTAGDYQSLFA